MKPIALTAEQRKEIDRRRKETHDRRVYQRLTAVLAVASGKTREDVADRGAILRTFGALPRSVLAIFTVQGALIGLCGTLAGAAFGVFFSTHVLSEVEKLCNRVAIIREGRIVRQSTIAELTQTGGHLIEVKFAQSGDMRSKLGLFSLDAAAEFSGGVHKLKVGENLQQLLRLLSDHAIADLNVRRPTLEERFMDEYRAETGASADKEAGAR